MSLPQIDTRSSLMRHSPSVMVGISTSMNSKSLGPTSCAAFITLSTSYKPAEQAQSVAMCARNWLQHTLWVAIVNVSFMQIGLLAWQRAARRGLQPVDTGARGEEEDATILAPGQVCGQLRQENTPQQLAIWAAHPHAAWPGAEHVAMQVHLETVGHAGVLRGHVQQDPAVGQRAIRTHIKGPDMLVGRIVDVQDRLVGREGQTVRQGKVVHQQVEGPVRCDAVHAIAELLFARDGCGPPVRRPWHAWRAGLDGVGRVGEVDGAVGLDRVVGGGVEPLALELLSQDRAGTVFCD